MGRGKGKGRRGGGNIRGEREAAHSLYPKVGLFLSPSYESPCRLARVGLIWRRPVLKSTRIPSLRNHRTYQVCNAGGCVPPAPKILKYCLQ